MTFDIQITVKDNEDKKHFEVRYETVNKYTNRPNVKSFKYFYGTRTIKPTENHIKGLMTQILKQFDEKSLFGTSKQDRNVIAVSEIRSLLTRKLKNMSRSHKGKIQLNDLDKGESNEQTHTNTDTTLIKKWGSKSIFEPEQSAKTCSILGASFSGKTTLLTTEINKLRKNTYRKIILFTESTNSSPLKNLNEDLDVKIIDRFCKQIPKLLKDINSETNNKFKFLLILDDVIDLKNNTFNKMILTMRNSNISTVVLLQYVKLITPSTRSSLHEYYITGLRTEDWEYMLRGFLASHFREILHERGSMTKLSEMVRQYMKGKILFYDQRKDKIAFYLK